MAVDVNDPAYKQAEDADFQRWLQSDDEGKKWADLFRSKYGYGSHGSGYSMHGARVSNPDLDRQLEQMLRNVYNSNETGRGKFYESYSLKLEQDEEAKEKERQAAVDKAIDDFYAQMNAPLDMNDPDVQRVVAVSSNAAQNQARRQGIEGAMSVANSEQATSEALGGLGMQRKQLALQALGMRNQRGLDMAQLQQQRSLADRDYATQLWADKQQQRLSQGQTIGAIAGGALGAISGAFLGGPTGAAAGLSAGAALGGGVGGQLSGAQPLSARPGSSRGSGRGY